MKTILFIFFLLLVGFVPFFGVIDIIGSQWLYLSILNLFPILFYRNDFLSFLSSVTLTFKPLLFYIVFVLFCIFSLIFSNNLLLSLVDLSRIVVTLFSILNFLFLYRISNLSLINISISVSIILLFELLYSYYPLFIYLLDQPYSSIDFSSLPKALQGVTGNRNVMAANVSFKIPFVIYGIYKSHKWIAISLSTLLFFAYSNIFLISSRASLISLFITLLIFSFFFIFNFKHTSVYRFILYILPIALFLLFVSSSNNYDTIGISQKVSSLSSSDTSVSQRLTLYSNALDYIYNHPFIGCGIGNWKIESLPYWKSLLTGYTVPYHAHNDFLELTAEIGLLGGIAYLLVFFFFLFFSLKLIKRNKSTGYLLLSITIVYFIDAMLNFPLERAISQVNFILIFITSLIIFQNDSKKFLS